jgi:protein-tyrosine phosphatase
MQALRDQGVSLLVSLLPPHEAMDLGLDQERACCEQEGIDFESFPIDDRDVPPLHEVTFRFLEHLLAQLQAGKNVVVHCRVGQGRSGLMAASLLVMAGVPEAEAVAQVAAARGLRIPDTQEQRNWISALAGIWKARYTF